MDQTILTKHMKKNIPDIHTGDTVRVHQIIKEGDKERVQVFEGLVIGTHGGKTLDGTFTVRKESFGVGVERIFPLHSPRIVKVERTKQSKVRRSKLYFIRGLSGKDARLKELNRDQVMWEEPEAEKELEKIAEETAREAEAAKAAKEAEEAELEKKAETALAAHEKTEVPTSEAVGIPTGSSDQSVGENVGKQKPEDKEDVEDKKDK